MSTLAIKSVWDVFLLITTHSSLKQVAPVMTKSVTKVIYKPDTQSTVEFIAIVHPDEFKKWKAGDTTISVSDVVDSFQIFQTGQGAQGILGQPSKQQLDTVFGTHNDIDCMKILLEKGIAQPSEAIAGGSPSTNLARGSADVKSGRNTAGF